MIRPAVCALALVGLAGCATAVPPAQADPPTRMPEASCNADAGRSFVGQRATQELGERALAATGARSLRWGPPDSAMTMDYREDRLNMFYNNAMIIERVTCG